MIGPKTKRANVVLHAPPSPPGLFHPGRRFGNAIFALMPQHGPTAPAIRKRPGPFLPRGYGG